jgi:hypothetical protein
MRFLFLCLFFSLTGLPAFPQGAHSTNFKPEEDGFHFTNAFTNTLFDLRGLKLMVSGNSGGMSYTSLDFYNRKMKTPRQSYPPPDHSLLSDYIYYRQISSISENAEKWMEGSANSFGWHNNELFYWGLQGTPGGRLQELKTYIDNGIPVPLGLFTSADGRSRPYTQVVAIGYDCGRYQGNLGEYIEDFKIFCYNPEYPDVISTLQANNTAHYYFWKDNERDGDHYAGYFVDTRYISGTPPPDPNTLEIQPDCKAHELVVTLITGEDGLRGGDDNCNIMVQFNDGTVQQFLNVNRRQPLLINSSYTAELWLANPVPLSAFKNIIVYTRPCDGTSGVACTNWKLNQVNISARGGFPDVTILNKPGNPILKKFSGKDFNTLYAFTNLPLCDTAKVKSGEAEAGSGTASQLLIQIRTGTDDLQGGHDNLNIKVSFRDGTSQLYGNVNAGINWPVNSANTVVLNLSKEYSLSDIMRLELQTGKCQESSCDNWNFQGITIKARGPKTDQDIFEQSGNPIYRFTGSNNVYSLILRKD